MSTVATEPKVDLQTAVNTALDFFRESFKSVKPADVQLEEIQFSETEQRWLITVGYDNPRELHPESLQAMVYPSKRVLQRKYKVVQVDAQTGHPISITIRQGL